MAAQVAPPSFIQRLLLIAADESLQDPKEQYCCVLKEAGLRCIDTDSFIPQQLDEENSLNHLNTTWNGDTVLHKAAVNGHLGLIPILMRYGADPAVRNEHGHTPYSLSKNKDVRDSFRRFMACYPAAWDYDSSHIPSPLTEEMEAERNKKDAERRKEKKKKRATKQRERAKREEREGEDIAAERCHQHVSESLSRRERLAMAAERRMAGQLPTSSSVLS